MSMSSSVLSAPSLSSAPLTWEGRDEHQGPEDTNLLYLPYLASPGALSHPAHRPRTPISAHPRAVSPCPGDAVEVLFGHGCPWLGLRPAPSPRSCLMFRAGSFPWLCPFQVYPTLPLVGLVLAGNPHFRLAQGCPVAPCPLGSPDKRKGR